MNELFSMQKDLNERIVREHKLNEVDLNEKRRIAFLVELGELANETRCFKYWSKKPASQPEVILEEYVDGLHFVLSLGLDLGINDIALPDRVKLQEKMDKLELTELFLSLYQFGSKKIKHEDFSLFFETFMGLGMKLGFSFEDIKDAYLKKNLVNHERQDVGY